VIGEPFAEIQIEALNDAGKKDSLIHGKRELEINGERKILDFIYGKAFYTIEISGKEEIEVGLPGKNQNKIIYVRYLPPWLSIIPPLFAILMALLTREVIISLFLSIFLGTFILKGFTLSNIPASFVMVLDTYIVNALTDPRHLSVIIFYFLVGGMVSIISHNGGIKGIIDIFSRYAHSSRSAQLYTYFLSFGIFYDNYSNNLIVGNAMRPVTDKYKVSRQKLNFIVHGTAASVTAIAFVTTWIGAELGYINDALQHLGITENTYTLFLRSLQYAYYPILMLIFIFILIWMKKDYGAMNLAEVESRNAGVIKKNIKEEEKKEIGEDIRILKPIEKNRISWLNAALPVLAFILTAFISLLITGANHLFEIINEKVDPSAHYSFGFVWNNIQHLADDQSEISLFTKLGLLISHSHFYITLLWSSLSGAGFAILISLFQKNIHLRETMQYLVQGFRLMLSAVIILIFAWGLAEVMHDLHTADYINSLITSEFIFPQLLPAIIFIIAALISFGTGSVYGTMAILYPLLLPLA
jgi:Na+/H+ antiporter NhaC